MKSILLLLSLLSLAAVAAKDSKADEAAIRKVVQDEVAAWNAGDAIAYSRHFAEDGTFTNIRGEFYSGHEAF
ncbi:MAG TPA: SgcJ/EcaC family oxidoreductase [Myxococcales bacterium]|jgi:ketosteroid isomerase-like protein